jgi:protein-tyrosine phosphatase
MLDVHSHLLPGIDDGCASLSDSIECAKRMVEAGYTQSFCTPHFWPSYPKTTVESIPRWVEEFQQQLEIAGVPLKLYPGSEINLRASLIDSDIRQLPTFGMAGKYALIDLWADRLPPFFEPTIRWMQSAGITVILAHPERMRAVQENPGLADYFAELKILLQGNLQCFSDRPDAATRITVEKFLADDRYTFLGSDLHNPETLALRLRGLKRAIELAGAQRVRKLTVENPKMLLEILSEGVLAAVEGPSH